MNARRNSYVKYACSARWVESCRGSVSKLDLTRAIDNNGITAPDISGGDCVDIMLIAIACGEGQIGRPAVGIEGNFILLVAFPLIAVDFAGEPGSCHFELVNEDPVG